MQGNNIRPIDRKSIHQICSGQVVLTLATAVKELVENSIDAGAINIEVKLKEFGSETVEVSDDGHGVRECDFESLTLKHHTSKLQDFSDLLNVDTFGFRGEALSSLCALCKLTVITCHRDSNAASRLEYDSDGILVKRSTVARQIGTTVILENIFSTLPVRHREFQKNLRKEFGKAVHLLSAYCIISIGKRITCVNTSSKGRKSVLLSTNGETSVKAHLTSLFGTKQVSSLMEFAQLSPTTEILEEFSLTDVPEMDIYKIEGYISSHTHGAGRSTADRQFFYINGRPCDLPKVAKLINNVYHGFNRYQYPFMCLNIVLSKESVDVNVTPDKRHVFVSHEKLLLAILKSSVSSMYVNLPLTIKHFSPLFTKSKGSSPVLSDGPSQTLQTIDWKRDFSYVKEVNDQQHSKSHCPDTSDANSENDYDLTNTSISNKDEMIVSGSDSQYGSQSPSSEQKMDELPSSGETQISVLSNSSLSSETSPSVECIETQPFNEDKIIEKVKINNLDSPTSSLLSNLIQFSRVSKQQASSSKRYNASNRSPISSRKKIKKNVPSPDLDLCNIDYVIEKHKWDLNNISTTSENEDRIQVMDYKKQSSATIVKDKPQVRKKTNILCDFSLEDLKKVWKNTDRKKDCLALSSKHRRFRSKLNAEDAEEELRTEIRKDMFAKMEIVGQFNLGFIITRLEEDLFIIDQHATDEKYNFELLKSNTVLETQMLLNPQILQLSAAAELTLLDNLPIFEKNGFKFQINEENSVGQRAQLVSVPISQNWTFGKEDVDELIFMLTDNTGVMCRPSRVTQMFASRACRKSVMIGTPLSHQLMNKIVHHMGDIEQPWNCPHGRPTMRHLLNLNLLKP